jgi:hypothetical protein
MNKNLIASTILIAAGYVNPSQGQSTASVLYIELQNVVEYQVDTTDLSKYGNESQYLSGQNR